MTTLTLDEETGMRGQAAFDWASTAGVHMKFKAPRQRAWIVERHNEIIRHGLHTTEQQLIKEGSRCTFVYALAIVLFMKNSLTVINNHTPYQGLLGRQPAMLPPIEGGHGGQVASHARAETGMRDEARVREIEAGSIIESIARTRLTRADDSQSRSSLERAEHKVGDLVDIWFEPVNKDSKGWRGPAEIKSINEDVSNVSVRMQGRTLDRRPQEIREHIPYLVYSIILSAEHFSHWQRIEYTCEQMAIGSVKIYGAIYDKEGWRMTSVSKTAEGNQIYQSAMIVAASAIYLRNCVSVRFWRGLYSVPPLEYFTESELFLWHPQGQTRGEKETPYSFTAEAEDLVRHIPSKSLAQDVVYNMVGASWQEVCFIQFLSVNDVELDKAVSANPSVELLGGSGFQRMKTKVKTKGKNTGKTVEASRPPANPMDQDPPVVIDHFNHPPPPPPAQPYHQHPSLPPPPPQAPLYHQPPPSLPGPGDAAMDSPWPDFGPLAIPISWQQPPPPPPPPPTQTIPNQPSMSMAPPPPPWQTN